MQRWEPPADTTIGELLSTQAAKYENATFIRHAEESLSYRQFDDTVSAWSAGLHNLGVEREFVAVMMPNSVETLVTWFAINRNGSAYAAINTGLKGKGLRHVLTSTKCTTLVIDSAYLDQFSAVSAECQRIERLIVRGDVQRARKLFPTLEIKSWDDTLGTTSEVSRVSVGTTDSSMVIFTSGTTGLAKGCVLSHRTIIRTASLFSDVAGFRPDDVLYCPFPLFHIDATHQTVIPALLNGSVAAIAPRFSVSKFWTDIRHYEATVFDFMGSTLAMLWNQPEKPDDADNPARLGWGVPMPAFAPEFEKRFGVELVSGYGLTEATPILFQPRDWDGPKESCGVPVWPFEVALLDELDNPVQGGEIGEFAVRSELPGMIFDGYLGLPDETLSASRNLWFHTGDLGRCDANGHYYFEGRKSDYIRRHGENISAQEVEEVFNEHPGVSECAAVAVPSDLGEDEVKVYLIPAEEVELDPAEVIEFVRSRIASYMLPRYVEIRKELPRTPTAKIQKQILRAEGVGNDAWERLT